MGFLQEPHNGGDDPDPREFALLAYGGENVLPNHYEVAITLENYADLLRVANRSNEAEVLEARAAAIRAKQAE